MTTETSVCFSKQFNLLFQALCTNKLALSCRVWFLQYKTGGKQASYFYSTEDSTLVSNGKGVTHGCGNGSKLSRQILTCFGLVILFTVKPDYFPLGNNVPNLRVVSSRGNRSPSNSPCVPTTSVQTREFCW